MTVVQNAKFAMGKGYVFKKVRGYFGVRTQEMKRRRIDRARDKENILEFNYISSVL